MAFDVSYIYKLKDQISPAIKKIARNMDSLDKKVKTTASKVGKSFDKMSKGLEKVRDVGSNLFVKTTLPISILGGVLLNTASNAEETTNRFNELFGELGKDATDSVNRLSKSFQLASSTSQELLANTGDLLQGIGFEKKAALELSESVVALSSDLASFKNVQGGAERVSLAITKALLGEREMLKDSIKVALREEEVKKRAIKIGKELGNLTEQQAKALATVQLITERSQPAIGDFARTQEQFANASRTTTESLKELSEQFGKELLPMAGKALVHIRKLIEFFKNLQPETKRTILMIGGLVAAASPLLIVLGSLGFAFTGLSIVMGPVGLTIAAISAAITSVVFVVKQAVEWFDKLSNKFNEIKKFRINLADNILGTLPDFMREFLGEDLSIQRKTESLIKVQENLAKRDLDKTINNQSSFAGKMEFIFKNPPKGMNIVSEVTEANNANINLGRNSIIAGAQ